MPLDMSPPTREKYLPVELSDLAFQLSQEFAPPQQARFQYFCELYLALHRVQLGQAADALKQSYRAFDPDRATVDRSQWNPEEREERLRLLHPQLLKLLTQANYEEIGMTGLREALNKTSPRGLEVAVDLEEFDELGLHYRGCTTRLDEKRDWRKLYLKKRQWETPVYRRLFLFFKLNPSSAEQASSDYLYLKLFRDVPQSDLEMLLPNTQVRMRIFDKVKIGVTGGGGTVGGVMATVTKLGVAANPMTWVLALVGLAGILWRQISKVFVQRTRYMADLAQQLYFCNLDNNFGALAHLSDLALEEEAKETLLAYAFLLQSEHGLSQEALDTQVETYLKDHFDLDVDYEVEDGVAKLSRGDFLVDGPMDPLQVVPLESALSQMQATWAALAPKG